MFMYISRYKIDYVVKIFWRFRINELFEICIFTIILAYGRNYCVF